MNEEMNEWNASLFYQYRSLHLLVNLNSYYSLQTLFLFGYAFLFKYEVNEYDENDKYLTLINQLIVYHTSQYHCTDA